CNPWLFGRTTVFSGLIGRPFPWYGRILAQLILVRRCAWVCRGAWVHMRSGSAAPQRQYDQRQQSDKTHQTHQRITSRPVFAITTARPSRRRSRAGAGDDRHAIARLAWQENLSADAHKAEVSADLEHFLLGPRAELAVRCTFRQSWR